MGYSEMFNVSTETIVGVKETLNCISAEKKNEMKRKLIAYKKSILIRDYTRNISALDKVIKTLKGKK